VALKGADEGAGKSLAKYQKHIDETNGGSDASINEFEAMPVGLL
jgi:hypothetical protein